jgi:hypothetical protein
LPRIAVRITISLGKNRYENKTLQFTFKTFVDIMGFLKTIMRIFIKIYGDILLKCSFKLSLKIINKLSYPAIVFVVFLAILMKISYS